MDCLFTYVSAIHRLSSPAHIERQQSQVECWPDQGFEVSKTTTTYWFDNGAVIRQTVEQDSFPAALACAECWISYEVIAQNDAAPAIAPHRKVFENTCRESFWLAYHRA